MKTHLNTDKELFFAFLWLLPLAPQLAIFFLYCIHSHLPWGLVVTMIIWFIVFGYVYYCNHYSVVIEDSQIIVLNKKHRFFIAFDQILFAEEIIYEDNSLKDHKYILHFDEAVGFKHNKLIIQNKEIQKRFDVLFPKIKVSKKYHFGMN
jgi:hypothetical protein